MRATTAASVTITPVTSSDRIVARRGDDGGELQPDQREHDRLQDGVARPPHRLLLQPGGVAALRGLVAQVEPGDDDREHAGGVRQLADQVHPERHDEPERALDVGVVEPGADQVHHPADRQPDRRAADRGEQEHPEPLEDRDPAARRHRDEHAEQRQRGGVVDEALAAQDRHEPPRQPEPPPDGQRRHRVRRRHHRAEHERRGQAQPRHHPPRHEPDRHRGEHRQPDREQPDRPQVLADAQEGRLQRRRVQQRRQHDEQHDVRVELHRLDAGEERRRDADHDQHERGGHVEAAADPGHRQRADHEGEQQQFRVHDGRMAH